LAMSLHPLVGHEEARNRVLKAIEAHRLPHAILLTGPRGVGKQRFGLWVGQAVLCEAETERPCGVCRACGQVLALSHPDLHWFMPVPRPKAGEPERQVEELADSQGEILAERRKKPLYGHADGMAGHFVATARLLLKRAALTPAVGKAKVFLLAEADRLVPQEASPEAANALLKLLEEPPADTRLILTAVDANRLLPTIRSRVVPLRLGRLTDRTVDRFLAEHAGLVGPALEKRVRQAEGSIGLALTLEQESGKAERQAEEVLQAIGAGAAARAERALKQAAWSARGDFAAMLDALEELLAVATRARVDAAGLPRPGGQGALVEARVRVAEAREAARGNVNPQLLLARLADDLAEVL
jgi:DNA polymerase III subunit delta'